MKLSTLLVGVVAIFGFAVAEIQENGRPRPTDYPDTVIDLSTSEWTSYDADSPELSYKGRWDSKHISWWSAPGLKFGFTGDRVAVTFGPYTDNSTLIGYRIDGQDWQFTNVTTNATHLLVNPDPVVDPGINITYPINPSSFELRVTNWAYGVQIDSVHVAAGKRLVKIPDYNRTLEIIGDSLSAGQYATYEGLASWSYGLAAGFGNTEYSITAYPGICLYDKQCYGNLRGQAYQWFQTSDTSGRAIDIWGDNPEPWDFAAHPAADIVLINIGTNDGNSINNVTSEGFVTQYIELVEGIHTIWPKAEIIIINPQNGFYADGNTYAQNGAMVSEIYSVYQYFNTPQYLSHPVGWNETTNTTIPSNRPTKPFVHYFDILGVIQHNDIGPQWHPTDVGHIKIASHLLQYIKLKFGWSFLAQGPEVQHDTLYWNTEQNY